MPRQIAGAVRYLPAICVNLLILFADERMAHFRRSSFLEVPFNACRSTAEPSCRFEDDSGRISTADCNGNGKARRTYRPTIPRTVSALEGRDTQSGCSRKGCVLGRRGGKGDGKCCYRTDYAPQDGKFDVLVRVREHNPSDVDGMKITPSQSLFRCHIRPQETRNYDPGDEQSDHPFD